MKNKPVNKSVSWKKNNFLG